MKRVIIKFITPIFRSIVNDTEIRISKNQIYLSKIKHLYLLKFNNIKLCKLIDTKIKFFVS